MGRCICHDCGLHEDYYRLKLNVYILSAKSALPSRNNDVVRVRHELEGLRSEAMDALRALLSHWKACEARRESDARAVLRMQEDQLASLVAEHKPAA